MSTANKKKSRAMKILEAATGAPVTLGKLIESIRLGEEESQPEFAAKLGISKSNLNDIEKERKAVSVERAARFAEKLGYSQERFIELALQWIVDKADLAYDVELEERVS